MAEYIPVLSRRERRFRNQGKLLFVAAAILVVLLIASMKVTIVDNDLHFEWVTVTNNEGDKISCLLLTPNDVPVGGAPAVIVTHDLTGHKEQLNRLSLELARQGFIVLAVDLRDHGMSGGQTTFLDYYKGEAFDIIAAYDYLVDEVSSVDPDRITLVGDGFGGAACLMAYDHMLRENRTSVGVVAWAPPIDITFLHSENWAEIEPWIERRMVDITLFENTAYRNNRTAIFHMDAPDWDSGAVYIIFGQKDELIPPNQFIFEISDSAELYEITNVGHDLSENEDVLKFTIDFIYRKTNKTPRVETDFNYQTVETLNLLLQIATVAVMVIAFMMTYEALVLSKANRSFIPQLDRNLKPLGVAVATLIDIVAYVAVAYLGGVVYARIETSPFHEILPASRFYMAYLFTGILLIVVGMGVWYVWSYLMPRDEERSDETCGNLRGLGAGLLAFIIVIINYIFGQILLYGNIIPKGGSIFLVAAFSFAFFLGQELWVRKLLHIKVQNILSRLFLRHRWPYYLTFFGIMFGLYALLTLIMLWNLGRQHFADDFWTAYYLVVLGIGMVTTMMYQRSKSLLATVTYSTIIAPWLLTLAHHL